MGFEDYQPVRLRIGQGLDDPGIDVAENGSVRSNAQRQCQNSNRGERTILRQHSRAIAQVLPKRLHQPLPASGSFFTLLVPPDRLRGAKLFTLTGYDRNYPTDT